MPANDVALRRALGRQAAAMRWGKPDVADQAAREAREIQLEHAIRTTGKGLTVEQRMRLAVILAGGDDNAVA